MTARFTTVRHATRTFLLLSGNITAGIVVTFFVTSAPAKVPKLLLPRNLSEYVMFAMMNSVICSRASGQYFFKLWDHAEEQFSCLVLTFVQSIHMHTTFPKFYSKYRIFLLEDEGLSRSVLHICYGFSWLSWLPWICVGRTIWSLLL